MNMQPDTAKDILARADKQAKRLGASYGRLQEALLTPLIKRVLELTEEDRNHVQRTENAAPEDKR